MDTAGEQLNGLTIRMEDFGNDIFLYWNSDCKGHEGHKDTYDFIPGIIFYFLFERSFYT